MLIAQTPSAGTRNSSQASRQPRLPAELSPWNEHRAGVGFGVMIESISAAGFEITHTDRVSVGGHYLIEIPRSGKKPASAACTITSIGRFTDHARFDTAPDNDDLSDLMTRLRTAPGRNVTTPRTKYLFILFGIVGLAAAILIGW